MPCESANLRLRAFEEVDETVGEYVETAVVAAPAANSWLRPTAATRTDLVPEVAANSKPVVNVETGFA